MTRFTIIMTSDFNLLNRSEAGEDITPILEQRAALGFNFLRVWTAYAIDKIGMLIPAQRPGLYQHIPTFLQDCADHGLYVQFTAFTGPYDVCGLETDTKKIGHWESLIGVCDGISNVTLELVNEWDNGPNLGLPLPLLRKPPTILSAHGSPTQDGEPLTPHWDLVTYRPAGSEWWRKVGHNAMEWANASGKPCFTNEQVRTDNDPNPAHWEDSAAGGVLLCAGAGCFHAPEGKTSTLFAGQTLALAEAFIKGARSVNLDYQQGPYVHRQDRESATVIRAYERPVAGLPEHVVEIRA